MLVPEIAVPEPAGVPEFGEITYSYPELPLTAFHAISAVVVVVLLIERVDGGLHKGG